MTDDALRTLERRWRASAAPEDERALIAARLRTSPACERCAGTGKLHGLCLACGGSGNQMRGRLIVAAMLNLPGAMEHVADEGAIWSWVNVTALQREQSDLAGVFETGGGRTLVVASEVAAHALRTRACGNDTELRCVRRVEPEVIRVARDRFGRDRFLAIMRAAMRPFLMHDAPMDDMRVLDDPASAMWHDRAPMSPMETMGRRIAGPSPFVRLCRAVPPRVLLFGHERHEVRHVGEMLRDLDPKVRVSHVHPSEEAAHGHRLSTMWLRVGSWRPQSGYQMLADRLREREVFEWRWCPVDPTGAGG